MRDNRAKQADRIFEMAGLLVVALSVLGILSLVSWSKYDPSLNNASNNAPQNWLGLGGAYLSDILVQTLGLASAAVFLIVSGWGIGLIRHVRPTWMSPVRFLVWPLAVVMWAGFSGTLPLLAIWALAPGLGFGGVLGDALATVGLQIFAPLFGISAAYVIGGALYFFAALLLTMFCAGRDMCRPFFRKPDGVGEPADIREAMSADNPEGGVWRASRDEEGALLKWFNIPSALAGVAVLVCAYLIFLFAGNMMSGADKCDSADVVSTLKGLVVGKAGEIRIDGGDVSSDDLLRVANIADEGRENARHHCSASIELSDTAKTLMTTAMPSFDANILQVAQVLLSATGEEMNTVRVRYDVVKVSDEKSVPGLYVDLRDFDRTAVAFWQMVFASMERPAGPANGTAGSVDGAQAPNVEPAVPAAGDENAKPRKKRFDSRNIKALLHKIPD